MSYGMVEERGNETRVGIGEKCNLQILPKSHVPTVPMQLATTVEWLGGSDGMEVNCAKDCLSVRPVKLPRGGCTH